MDVRRISEIEEIAIPLQSPVRMYETALKQAIDVALMKFGIDDCGHSSCVEEWERCCCSVKVTMQTMEASGSMGGWNYNFLFHAWCERYDEPDVSETFQ